MNNKVKHIAILCIIFIFATLIGYQFYKFTQNFDNEKEVDTSIKDTTDKITKEDSNNYRQEKTLPDSNGKTSKLKLEGKIDLENGSWDFICKNPLKNKCNAAILVITSPDDKDLEKKHPINEYIVVDGKKTYNYKVDGTKAKTNGLYFRKRKDN